MLEATDTPVTALVSFRPIEAGLVRLKAFTALTIDGIKDAPGYKAVHAARMEVRSVRVTIETVRKDAKADLLVAGRNIDDEAKRLTALISPIEAELEAKEAAIDAEKEAIRKAKEDAERARIQVRVNAFAEIQMQAPVNVADMTDTDYQAAYAAAKLERARLDKLVADELKRVADEQEAMRKEREELARLRAEQDRVKAEQEAQAKALRDQEAKLAAQEAARVRQLEYDAQLKAAAEQATRDTEARLQREADAKAQAKAMQLEMEAEAKAKALADMPWRQKILAVASAVDAIEIPEGHAAMAKVEAILAKAAADIRKIANGAL